MPVARLPPFLMNTDHRERCLNQLRSKATGLEKYIYLNSLKERDPNLFYEILIANMLEIIPILYTPTVNIPFRSVSFRRRLLIQLFSFRLGTPVLIIHISGVILRDCMSP